MSIETILTLLVAATLLATLAVLRMLFAGVVRAVAWIRRRFASFPPEPGTPEAPPPPVSHRLSLLRERLGAMAQARRKEPVAAARSTGWRVAAAARFSRRRIGAMSASPRRGELPEPVRIEPPRTPRRDSWKAGMGQAGALAGSSSRHVASLVKFAAAELAHGTRSVVERVVRPGSRRALVALLAITESHAQEDRLIAFPGRPHGVSARLPRPAAAGRRGW